MPAASHANNPSLGRCFLSVPFLLQFSDSFSLYFTTVSIWDWLDFFFFLSPSFITDSLWRPHAPTSPTHSVEGL